MTTKLENPEINYFHFMLQMIFVDGYERNRRNKKEMKENT
jgi:hypothetical protein